VEQSGTPLHLLFRKSPKAKVCGRTDCMSCRFENKKQSMCSVKNIVYESVCTWCEKDENKVPGQEPYKYIGETSRTLYERMKEHWSDAGKIKDCSHIARHWATVHSESLRPPLFKFTVVKKHTRALSRQIHEAVRISSKGNLNDKLEWKINSIDRLGTKLNHREEEALRKEEINNKRERDNRMNDLKNRLNSSAPPLPSFTQPEMSHGIVGGYVVEGPTSHRNELKKKLRNCAPPLSSFTQIQMSRNTVGGNVVEGPTSHREAPVCGKKIARRHRTKESSDKSNKIYFNFRDLYVKGPTTPREAPNKDLRVQKREKKKQKNKSHTLTTKKREERKEKWTCTEIMPESLTEVASRAIRPHLGMQLLWKKSSKLKIGSIWTGWRQF